eukprot:scaffold7453_cov31-Prasinocladus_malaysianus.AAC.1
MYMNVDEDEDEIDRALCSVTGEWWSLDDTFKATKFALGSHGGKVFECNRNVQNEYGEIMLYLFNSFKDLASSEPMIKRLAARSETLRQHGMQAQDARFLTVDDLDGNTAAQAKDYWTRIIPTLSSVFVCAWHWMDRYKRSLYPDHPLIGKFMRLLSQCIFYWEHDEASGQKYHKLRPLEDQVSNTDQLINIYEGEMGVDIGTKLHLFTVGGQTGGTKEVHTRNRQLLLDGFLQAVVLSNRDDTAYLMWIPDPDPTDSEPFLVTFKPDGTIAKATSKRTNSKVENYHRHFAKFLSSIGCMGLALFNKACKHFVQWWNRRMAVINRGHHDIGHFSLYKMRRVSKLHSQLGLEAKTPDFHLAPETYRPTEKYGAEWTPGDEPAIIADVHSIGADEDAGQAPEDLGVFLAKHTTPQVLVDPRRGGDATCIIELIYAIVGTTNIGKAAKPDRQRGKQQAHAKVEQSKQMQPVSTDAEKDLFAELYDDCSRGDNVNYAELALRWAKSVTGKDVKNPQHQVHPKTTKLLKAYGEARMKETVHTANVNMLSSMQSSAYQEFISGITKGVVAAAPCNDPQVGRATSAGRFNSLRPADATCSGGLPAVSRAATPPSRGLGGGLLAPGDPVSPCSVHDDEPPDDFPTGRGISATGALAGHSGAAANARPGPNPTAQLACATSGSSASMVETVGSPDGVQA